MIGQLTDSASSRTSGDTQEENAKYLDELVKDMRELNCLSGSYPHALRLLTEEIDRVWSMLYVRSVSPPPRYSNRVRMSPPSTKESQQAATANNIFSSFMSPYNNNNHAASNNPTIKHLQQLSKGGNSASAVGVLAPTSGGGAGGASYRGGGASALSAMHSAGASDSANPYTLYEKIPIPYYPRCNFIGRILGPRGISVKQLESETDCHILVRGQGSVKDPQREARLAQQPGWEHLAEPLHVLVSATDLNHSKCAAKLQNGVDAVSRLLTPSDDEHKRRQLIQLAIINGTYRTDEPEGEVHFNSNKNTFNGSQQERADEKKK